MKWLKRFAVNRLREPSTWRAMVGLSSLFGVVIQPDQVDKIVGAGVAAYLVLEAFLPDRFGAGSDVNDDRMPPQLPSDIARGRQRVESHIDEKLFFGPD